MEEFREKAILSRAWYLAWIVILYGPLSLWVGKLYSNRRVKLCWFFEFLDIIYEYNSSYIEQALDYLGLFLSQALGEWKIWQLVVFSTWRQSFSLIHLLDPCNYMNQDQELVWSTYHYDLEAFVWMRISIVYLWMLDYKHLVQEQR